MAQPTKTAQNTWQSLSGEDFLQCINSSGGSVVGGIDSTGAGYGALLSGGGAGPATKTLYVDGNRTDAYTADGSIGKPFTTIMGAVNQVIANGDNSLSVIYLIKIQAGTYNEKIVLENSNLVSLVFYGYGAALVTGGFQSTANNSNLQATDFRQMNFSGGNLNVQGSGNLFAVDLNFYDCFLTFLSWTQTQGGMQCFDTSVTANMTLSNTQGNVFMGNRGVSTGGTISLTGGTFLTVQRGSRCGSNVTTDATSAFNIIQARMDGTVTVNGTFLSRMGIATGAITVNNGGTYSEHGGTHEGTLTINAGGAYTQVAVLGAGSLVLGAAAPSVPSGSVGLGNGTATSASAGAQTLPANPNQFLIVNVGGTIQKIPLYNA